METFILLNSNDIEWEYKLLRSAIEAFILEINDFKGSIMKHCTESSITRFSAIRDKHIIINDQENKITIAEDYVRKYLKSCTHRRSRLSNYIQDFNNHFRGDKNAIQYTLELKEVINSKKILETDGNEKVILIGITELEIERSLESNKNELLNVIELYTKELQLKRKEEKWSRVRKFIQPPLVEKFIEFEMELIEKGWLTKDYKWNAEQASPTDLARCIKCLFELDYLNDHKFKGIREYIDSTYETDFQISGNSIFKPNKIQKMDYNEDEFPYVRLEILKS